MTIIVETGEGLPNAQTYVSVEEATEYNTLMGNTIWSESADKQETALARATQTVDAVWGSKFLSRKTSRGQALLFPRLGFYDNNQDYVGQSDIPRCLKQAVIEMALQYLTTGEDPLANNNTVGIKSTKQKVGDLEESIAYSGTNDAARIAQDKYSKPALLLAPLLTGPDFGIRL